MKRPKIKQSGHNLPPVNPKTIEEWRRDQRAKAEERRRLERQNMQLVLPLNLPKETICPGCGGLGCLKCKQRGVVVGEAQPVTTFVVNCPRCYGVGQVADKQFQVKTCRRCNGEGKIEQSASG